MRIATTALAAVGFAGCMYFVAAYWAMTRGAWRQSPVGRHLMAFTFNLGVLLGLVVAARVWGDYPMRVYLSALFFGAFVIQIVYRCVLLHRAQHRTDPPGL